MSDEEADAQQPEGMDEKKRWLGKAIAPIQPDDVHDYYNFRYHTKGLIVAMGRELLSSNGFAVWPAFPEEPDVTMMTVEGEDNGEKLVCVARIKLELTLVHVESGESRTLEFWGEEVKDNGRGALSEAQEQALKTAYKCVLAISRVDPSDPPVADDGRGGGRSGGSSRRRSSSGRSSGRSSGGSGGGGRKGPPLTKLVNDSEVEECLDALGLDPEDPDDWAAIQSRYQDAGKDHNQFKQALKEEAS